METVAEKKVPFVLPTTPRNFFAWQCDECDRKGTNKLGRDRHAAWHYRERIKEEGEEPPPEVESLRVRDAEGLIRRLTDGAEEDAYGLPKRHRKHWTDEEWAKLKEAENLPFYRLLELFPDRTAIALHGARQSLRKREHKTQPKKGWTPQQDQFLFDNHLTMTTREIAAVLKKSCNVVTARAKAKGFRIMVKAWVSKGKVGRTRWWTDQDKQQLRDLVGDYGVKVIAEMTNRTPRGVYQMCRHLKLQWNTGGYSLQDVADILGVGRWFVSKIRNLLGQRWGIHDPVKHVVTQGAEDEHVQAIAQHIWENRLQYRLNNAPIVRLKLAAEGQWDHPRLQCRFGREKAA